MRDIYCRDHAGRWELSIIGHAGYDDSGRDIVCAAASALTYALAEYCDTEYERLAAGDTKLVITKTERNRHALETACTGYRQLAEAYPDHVRYTPS